MPWGLEQLLENAPRSAAGLGWCFHSVEHTPDNNKVSRPSHPNHPGEGRARVGGGGAINNVPSHFSPKILPLSSFCQYFPHLTLGILALMKDTRELIAENSLTPYESAMLKGLKTRGSEALKSKIISEAVTGVMNSTIEVDGQPLSVAEALVIKVTGDALANPSTSKLKDLAAILGDLGSTKVELINSQVDEDLARAAIGEDD